MCFILNQFYLGALLHSCVLFEQFTLGLCTELCDKHASIKRKIADLLISKVSNCDTKISVVKSRSLLCDGFQNSRISFIKIHNMKLSRQKDVELMKWNTLFHLICFGFVLFIVSYYWSKSLTTILSRSISKVTHFKWLYNEQNANNP